MKHLVRVLTIAGSDSGGGAGLQADIKTLTALGCYATSAVTAVTVQDTMGVHAVHKVPPEIVRSQIASVLDDIGADAIKIGMLVGADIVGAVADLMEAHASIPMVLDTVIRATSGTMLLDDPGVNRMKARLFPRADLVTPNAPEAALLTDMNVETTTNLVQAGQALIAMGARAALVKGGHLAGAKVTDALVTSTDVYFFESVRLDTRSTHGTGCTLASACAAGLAQGMSLYDSVARAHRFVHEALRTAPGLGHGTGPLNHLHTISNGQAI